MTNITKDADKLACSLYKTYLMRRRNGIDKTNAKHYSYAEIKSLKPFNTWNDADTKETIAELSRANFGKMYLDCSFMANDEFIIYMENRFKNGFKEVSEFISQFIP